MTATTRKQCGTAKGAVLVISAPGAIPSRRPLRGCVSAGEGFKGAGTVQWAEYPRRGEHCAKAPIPIRDVDQTPDFQTLGLAFHLLSIVGKEL